MNLKKGCGSSLYRFKKVTQSNFGQVEKYNFEKLQHERTNFFIQENYRLHKTIIINLSFMIIFYSLI